MYQYYLFCLGFTVFLPSFMGFSLIQIEMNGFYWVLLGFTVFLPSFTGFSLILIEMIGLSWVLLDFTGFYLVFISIIRLATTPKKTR